jgi:hypothetical protein
MTVDSRKHRYVHARSWLFVLAPITLIFAGAVVTFAVIFTMGFLRADGERLLFGAFGTVGSTVLLLIVRTQLRNTIRDARTARAQRRRR